MSFFNRARAKANTFFRGIPSHIGKARTFFTGAVGTAKKANNLLQYVNRGVQENDVFAEKVKRAGKQAADFTDLGLKRIEDFHRGGDKFLHHLQNAPT